MFRFRGKPRQAAAGFAWACLASLLVAALFGVVWFEANPNLAEAQQPPRLEIDIQERINQSYSPQASFPIEIHLQERIELTQTPRATGTANVDLQEVVVVTDSASEAGAGGRQGGNGRGLVGRVVSIDRDAVVVSVLGQEIRVLLGGITRIRSASDFDAGIDDIPLNSRVAIVTDQPAASGTSTALFITLIPDRSTRKHTRVLAAEIRSGEFTVVDRLGNTSVVTGGSGIESGESLVLLVQGAQGDEPQTRQRFLTTASSVFDRLNSMSRSQPEDSKLGLGLMQLRLRHQQDQENRLLETIGLSKAELSPFFKRALQHSQRNRGLLRRDAAEVSEFSPARLACIFRLLGFIPKDTADLTAEQLAPVDEHCPAENKPPTIRLVSTDPLDTGEDDVEVILTAETEDDGYIVDVTWTVDDVTQFPDVEFPENNTFTITLPKGFFTVDDEQRSKGEKAAKSAKESQESPFIVIVATATDDEGARSSATVTFTWEIDEPPVVLITSPEKGGKGITEGATITLEAKAESKSNKLVSSAEFTVDGKAYPAKPKDGGSARDLPTGSFIFMAEVTLPARPDVSQEISSIVVPHVFTGTATIDGVPAPDDTEVTAWVRGRTSSTSAMISFTATFGPPVSATDSIDITVLAKQVQIGSAVVTDGVYTLFANQLAGQTYTGRVVTFRSDGRVADRSGTWELGGADELNLAWGSP